MQKTKEIANDEEADRQLAELVQELRLVLPGTTVLFGFPLSVPFAARFDSLTSFDRVVYSPRSWRPASPRSPC